MRQQTKRKRKGKGAAKFVETKSLRRLGLKASRLTSVLEGLGRKSTKVAIEAGELLNKARVLPEMRGLWGAWLKHHNINETTARRCMALAALPPVRRSEVAKLPICGAYIAAGVLGDRHRQGKGKSGSSSNDNSGEVENNGPSPDAPETLETVQKQGVWVLELPHDPQVVSEQLSELQNLPDLMERLEKGILLRISSEAKGTKPKRTSKKAKKGGA